VSDRLEAFNDLATRENRSRRHAVVRVSCAIGEVKRFTLPKNSHHDIAVHILRGRLSCVHKFRGDKEGFVQREREIAFCKN